MKDFLKLINYFSIVKLSVKLPGAGYQLKRITIKEFK